MVPRNWTQVLILVTYRLSNRVKLISHKSLNWEEFGGNGTEYERTRHLCVHMPVEHASIPSGALGANSKQQHLLYLKPTAKCILYDTSVPMALKLADLVEPWPLYNTVIGATQVQHVSWMPREGGGMRFPRSWTLQLPLPGSPVTWTFKSGVFCTEQ